MSITTGVNLTRYFEDIYELGCYMFDNPLMTKQEVEYLKKDMKKHIFDIHPELKHICYVPSNTKVINKWLYTMKCLYGEYLPISLYGRELDEIKLLKK